jgi:hypothetical protein
MRLRRNSIQFELQAGLASRQGVVEAWLNGRQAVERVHPGDAGHPCPIFIVLILSNLETALIAV